VGVGDKLKNIGTYVRKRWRSTDPDSYGHYRRGHERTRKQAEHTREAAERRVSRSVRTQSGGVST
jgi:hypothetical protein